MALNHLQAATCEAGQHFNVRKDCPCALVAVLDSDLKMADASPGTLSQLREAAAEGQMDFFAARAKDERNEGPPSNYLVAHR
jgi:hypothetical protein